MKESVFGQKIIDEMIRICYKKWHVKIVGHDRQKAGIPDWLLSLNGRFVGIEFKIQKHGKINLPPLQANEINKIRDSGGLGWLIAYCEQSGKMMAQYNKPLPIIFEDCTEISWDRYFTTIKEICRFLIQEV